MEIRLLGPVEVGTAGGEVSAGPPRQRAVLAAIAVSPGKPVLAGTIIDRVWGNRPPNGVRHALHVYITRLRRVGLAIVRGSGGYTVDIDPDRVDLCRFIGLLERARDLPPAARAGLLREALTLWRAEALAGLPGEWAAGVRQNWAARRLDATLSWARAETLAGDPAACVPALTELAAEHPLHEPLAAGLIRALHAVGRTADALACFGAIRQRLADELGVDPGAELREAHRSLLGRPASVRSAVPAQLPPDMPGFAGRSGALAQLDAMPATVRVATISGSAGVGKTALAVHWAHRVRDRFPDGQLHVDLRGFDPGAAVPAPQAVRGFLEALGVPDSTSTVDGRFALYRRLLAGRRMLVVLDNARDAEQVRELLPSAPGCLVLVSSRRQLTGLVVAQGAHPVSLDVLTPAESRSLLAARVGPARLAAEPAAVTDIVTRCAGLPLALSVVAARAATHPEFSLADLAAELRDSLDALSGDDPRSDVRAVFARSYQALSPRAARLFRLLALHPGPDLTIPAATSLFGEPARPALAELAGVHLVAEHAPGRFRFHDLLRAYATELMESRDSAAVREAATHRMLDHYLHAAGRVSPPDRPRPARTTGPALPPCPVSPR